MSKNRIYIYQGEQGLHCECGNSDVLDEDSGDYKAFATWWDTTHQPSGMMAACRKCNSDGIRAEVIPRPKENANS